MTIKANKVDTPTEATVTLETVSLAGATSVDIADGLAGANGPVLFKLWKPADGAFGDQMVFTCSAASFTPSAGMTTLALAIGGMAAGSSYINVSTTAHPAGQIRAQTELVETGAKLTGAGEVPPSGSTRVADCLATTSVLQDAVDLSVSGTTLDLATIRSVEVHVGPAGVSGPVILSLQGSKGQISTTAGGVWGGRVDNSNLTIQVGAGVDQFEDAINALLSGQCYLEVRTAAHPTGEFRGQLVAK